VKTLQGGQEFFFQKAHGGDVDGRGEEIVARLAQVDVVIGVDRPIDSSFAAEKFVGPIGNHLVGIHVGGGAGARLKDVEYKLIIPSTLHHLLGSPLNGLRPSSFQELKIKICPGRGILNET
jgi:hypothetical protein